MNSETFLEASRKSSGWSMLWGFLMLVCGILAISLPLASSIGIVIVLAWLILFAGILHLIFAFQSHSIGGFLWKLLLAIVYGVAGLYMLMNPVLGVISLTLLLAVFFLFEGVVEIAFYFRDPRGPKRWLGFVRRYHYPDSRILNLAALALELGLGYRNSRRHQLDLQRHFQDHAVVGHTPCDFCNVAVSRIFMAHPTAPFVLLNEISGTSDCAGLKDAAKCLLGSRANSYTPAGLSARLIPGSRAVVERAPSNMPDELPDIGNAAKEALI